MENEINKTKYNKQAKRFINLKRWRKRKKYVFGEAKIKIALIQKKIFSRNPKKKLKNKRIEIGL